MALKKFPMGQAPVVTVHPPPTVPPPPQNLKSQIDLQATKGVLAGRLANAVNLDAAAKKLNEAMFSLSGNTLQIQTNLSATMVRMLFNDEAMHLMESALIERGAGNIKIKLLPASISVEVDAAAPFRRLAASAEKLNNVSDQLTTQIEKIDAALKRFNLGVPAWVTIEDYSDEEGNCTKEELGYARIGNRWGIVLRTQFEALGNPGLPDETFSAFADAPRQLRMRAVQHIPALIDQLSVEAEATIANLTPKLDEVSELATTLQNFNSFAIGQDASKAIRKVAAEGLTLAPATPDFGEFAASQRAEEEK
jgi:hypothetical protein